MNFVLFKTLIRFSLVLFLIYSPAIINLVHVPAPLNIVTSDRGGFLELLNLTYQIFFGSEKPDLAQASYDHECSHADVAISYDLIVEYGIEFYRAKENYFFRPLIRISGTFDENILREIVEAPNHLSDSDQIFLKTF